MVKKVSLDSLAKMMKKGFDETSDKNDTLVGLLKLTRQEMAKDEDLKEVKSTVNTLYEMLDDEARFIQQMRSEYPLILKRLERLEKKLGLPHRVI